MLLLIMAVGHAEVIALAVLDTEMNQGLKLACGFHRFSDHRRVHLHTKRGERGGYGSLGRIFVDVGNQLTVDLDEIRAKS